MFIFHFFVNCIFFQLDKEYEQRYFYCFIKTLRGLACVRLMYKCFLHLSSDFLYWFFSCRNVLSEAKVGSGADSKEGGGTWAGFCFWSPYLAPGPDQALGIQCQMRQAETALVAGLRENVPRALPSVGPEE